MSERRATILSAAERLFHHYGHAKTTIADIAREARVAVGSVYLEFASKEAIVEELSSGTHERVLEAMRRAAREHEPKGFQRRFSSVLEVRVERLLELRREGQHACELVFCKADGVKSAHARYKQEEQALLRALLEDARDAGALGALEPRAAAVLVQRALASLSPPMLFDLEVDEARRTAAAMAELLLSGLLARNAGAVAKKPRR